METPKIYDSLNLFLLIFWLGEGSESISYDYSVVIIGATLDDL
jgi:hypothetical protein